MTNVIQPQRLLVIALASWLNRQQQTASTVSSEKTACYKEQSSDRRLQLTHRQRRRLVAKSALLFNGHFS